MRDRGKFGSQLDINGMMMTQRGKTELICLLEFRRIVILINYIWLRFQRMFVGREWQGMFVEAREKVVKGVTIAKCLKCDIKKWSTFNMELEKSLTDLKVRFIRM